MKIGLSPEEVKQLEDIELDTDSKEHHARNLWLISFYFAGMRASDLLRMKWADFQNDQLYYSMGKNEKPGSLKVPEKALRILSEYRDKNYAHDLVFPYLEMQPDLKVSFGVQKLSALLDRPNKLTTSGRGKLTTLFAGEDLTLSIFITWQELISASFLVIKYFC